MEARGSIEFYIKPRSKKLTALGPDTQSITIGCGDEKNYEKSNNGAKLKKLVFKSDSPTCQIRACIGNKTRL